MSTITVEKKREFDRPIRVCNKCIDILCLDGYIDSNFVVSKTIFKLNTTCDLCLEAPADFIIIPSKRGIFICEPCFRSLTTTSKHRWQNWPKKHVEEDVPCDLCGRKADFHIMLPRRK